jgi:hypothetical protein
MGDVVSKRHTIYTQQDFGSQVCLNSIANYSSASSHDASSATGFQHTIKLLNQGDGKSVRRNQCHSVFHIEFRTASEYQYHHGASLMHKSKNGTDLTTDVKINSIP